MVETWYAREVAAASTCGPGLHGLLSETIGAAATSVTIDYNPDPGESWNNVEAAERYIEAGDWQVVVRLEDVGGQPSGSAILVQVTHRDVNCLVKSTLVSWTFFQTVDTTATYTSPLFPRGQVHVEPGDVFTLEFRQGASSQGVQKVHYAGADPNNTRLIHPDPVVPTQRQLFTVT